MYEKYRWNFIKLSDLILYWIKQDEDRMKWLYMYHNWKTFCILKIDRYFESVYQLEIFAINIKFAKKKKKKFSFFLFTFFFFNFIETNSNVR